MKISKKLTAAFAIAAAAILVPTMALASPSRSAAPQRPAATAPACGNAHPDLRDGAFVWGSSLGDGFAGGVGYVLEITNEGTRACSVHGAPGAAVESNGHLIGSKVPASGAGPAHYPEARPDRVLHFDNPRFRRDMQPSSERHGRHIPTRPRAIPGRLAKHARLPGPARRRSTRPEHHQARHRNSALQQLS